jgi:hypothetical protein
MGFPHSTHRPPWYPLPFREAPDLPATPSPDPQAAGKVLLINPFYSKDSFSSFGKRVFNPSLALESIAAATPPSFGIELWDENLLQGPPPVDPLRGFVGITVRLTFARRAYDLGSNRPYLRELCRALRPLELIWSAVITIEVTDDPKLVREMTLSGYTGIFVGFESLPGANLTEAHNATPDPSEYPWRIRLLQENGIQVNGRHFLDAFDCPADPAMHVAIIMDGNGRWERSLVRPRTAGHQKVGERVREVVTRRRELGIRYLTLFAFSSENWWGRLPAEVSVLMCLLSRHLASEPERLRAEDIELAAGQ